jgi:hypothetical protein
MGAGPASLGPLPLLADEVSPELLLDVLAPEELLAELDPSGPLPESGEAASPASAGLFPLESVLPPQACGPMPKRRRSKHACGTTKGKRMSRA